MLEGIISALLQRYLGSVVQLDSSEQLKVGVWSGRLHLTQLTILPSAFSSLPFTLVRGRIGSFELQLNWAKMQSVPVMISLSQLHVLLRPRRQRRQGGRAAAGQRPHDWTAGEVAEWMEREKQRLLETAFAQSAALFAEAASSASPSSFAASFLASVVDNLQVRVEDVHVCVEGPGEEEGDEHDGIEQQEDDDDEDATDASRSSVSELNDSSASSLHSRAPSSSSSPSSAASTPSAGPSSPPRPSISSSVLVSLPSSASILRPQFRCGLVLRSLSMETTDADGLPTFVKSAGSTVYKRLQAGGLGVYWTAISAAEARTARYVQADDIDAFSAFMSAPFSSASSSPPPYVLRPIDATVQLQLSKHNSSAPSAANETKKQPRVSASLHLPALSMQLNARQLRSLSRAASQLSASLPPDLSHELRNAPFVSPAADSRDAASLWRYAIAVHRHRIHERREESRWSRLLQARRDYSAYVPLYRSRLHALRDGREEEGYRREQRLDIERRWPARTLLTWRSLVEQQTRISAAYSAVRQRQRQQQQQRSYLYTPIATGVTVAGWLGSFIYSAGAGAGAGGGAAAAGGIRGEAEERMPELSSREREQLASVLGYDPYGPLEQLIGREDREAPLYHVDLEVQELSLLLYQPPAAPDSAAVSLALLSVQSLSASAFLQSSETSVQLEVRALHVEDCMQRDAPHFRFLVTSAAHYAPQIAALRDDEQAAADDGDAAQAGGLSSPFASPSSSFPSPPPASSSLSLIKVSYRHHDNSRQQQSLEADIGSSSTAPVEESGVFTRTLSVPSLPSRLLSVSDSVELHFNRLHVNWNRTTISLLVDFITAEENEDDDEEMEREEAEEQQAEAGKEERAADAAEQDRSRLQREKRRREDRRRTLPAALQSPPQPMQASPSVHLRNRSLPLPSSLAVLPPPMSPPAASSSSSRLHPSDPRPLLRVLTRKLKNVSLYRQHRDAADAADSRRELQPAARKLRLNHAKQRQLEEQQLAREESASVPLMARGGGAGSGGGHGDGGGGYSLFRLTASLQSFSLCLNDELADATLVQAEIAGLNLSVEQSQPDAEAAGDEADRRRFVDREQTLQVKGTVGGLTVFDTLTPAAGEQAMQPSPLSSPGASPIAAAQSSPLPPSALQAPHVASSLSSSSFAASPAPLPPRPASRVFWKRRASDHALLSFSFSMQPQPLHAESQHEVGGAGATPAHRGYDASLNLRLSSVSAVISADFLRPLLAFASEGLLRQATDKAAREARKAIDTIREDLESRSFLFKYVVAVDTPLVFLPHSRWQRRLQRETPDSMSDSPQGPQPLYASSPLPPPVPQSEYLVLDLGRISLYNEFYLSEAEHRLQQPRAAADAAPVLSQAPLERIHISLAAVNLLRATAAPPQPSPPPMFASAPSLPSRNDVSLPLSAPPSGPRRSFSHDRLPDAHHRDDDSQHVSVGSSPSSRSAFVVSDAGELWRDALKRKLVEDMDIQVKLVSPLAQLRFDGLDALQVSGDISTVRINLNERLYAFLLSLWMLEVQPLLALTEQPSRSAPSSLSLSSSSSAFDLLSSRSSLVEERWGQEQDEQPRPQRRSSLPSLQPVSEVQQPEDAQREAGGSSASSASASAAEAISVNLSFREIFIDVQLSAAESREEEDVSQRSPSPFGSVDASRGESSPASRLPRLWALEPASPTSAPLPFAQIRASTLQLSARLRFDAAAAAARHSSFECSVARLSVQDSRTDCAHPLFRQIVGGHKDDLTRSGAQALSRRRMTGAAGAAAAFASPASSFSSAQSAASSPLNSVIASPLLQPHALSVDWSNSPSALAEAAAASSSSSSSSSLSPAPTVIGSHSRLFPSQLLLTPVMPKSPTRSPLPLYHRLSASIAPHSLQTPLPPTILPDLLVSGEQDEQGRLSVDVDFTAPRLVLSSGCITAIMRAADIVRSITEALLASHSAQQAQQQPDSRAAAADERFASFASGHDTASPPYDPPVRSAPPQPSGFVPQPAAVSAAAVPITVHVAIHDPQVWLMADAETESELPTSRRAGHLTALSATQVPADSPLPSGSSSLLHPATQAAIRRNLNLPDYIDASPVSGDLPSDDEDEDEAADDEYGKHEQPQHKAASHVRSGPKSLSCLVIRCQVDITATLRGDDVQAVLDMTELQALCCYRAHHLRLALLSLPPVPIFEPLHLNVDYSSQADSEAAASAASGLSSSLPLPIERAVISLSTLDACFSFLQISTATSILYGLLRVLPPGFFFKTRPPAQQSAAFDASASSSSPLPEPAVPSTFRGTVELHTAGAELAIVNDAPGYYVPLLRFSLPTLSLSYSEGMMTQPQQLSAVRVVPPPAAKDSRSSSSSSRFSWPFSKSSTPSPTPSSSASALSSSLPPPNLSLSLQLTISGSFYNSEMQQWESFFSPWSLAVQAVDARVRLSSADVFSVTVSPSCIQTLARGVDSFQTHFMPTIAALIQAQQQQDTAAGSAQHSGDDAAALQLQSHTSHTPPRLPSASSSPTSAYRKAALSSPADAASASAAEHRGAGGAGGHAVPAVSASADKASYFIVRNETGTRLRFWSIEEGTGDGSSGAAHRDGRHVLTLDAGEQKTVELRQYIGVGSGGDESGRRWLYRSPALGVSLEAGRHSGRWEAWNPVDFVSLAASEESNRKPVSALQQLSALHDEKPDESIAGLTVHRLAAKRGSADVEHQRQSSVDSTASLLASLSSLPLGSSTPSLSALPSPGTGLSFPWQPASPEPAAIPDTWLACRLVSGSDAEGSAAKVLIVSSALLAINRTFLELELQLRDTVRQETIFSALLASGQSVALPVLSVPSRHVRLLLRPAGGAGAGAAGAQWGWSQDGPRLSFIRQSAFRHSVLRCEAVGRDGRPSSPSHSFYARLNVFRASPSPLTSVDSFSAHTVSASAAAAAAVSSSSSSLPPSLSSSSSPDDGVYSIAVDPPLAFKNMLGCELDYRVTVREQVDDAASTELSSWPLTLSSSGCLPHRQEVHWYGMDLGLTSSAVVQLSIRRSSSHAPAPSQPQPVRAQRALSTSSTSSSLSSAVSDFRFLADSDHRFLAASQHQWSREWSEPVVIHSACRGRDGNGLLTRRPSIPLMDRDGRVLHVHLDYSDSSSLPASSSSPSHSSRVFPFAGAGPGLVSCYVPYWLLNCSGLPLVVGSVSRWGECELCPGQSEEELERRAAALTEQEDAMHRDTAGEQWFTFAESRKQQERQRGLQLLLGEDDAAAITGASASHRGWHPALRSRPYEQPPFLLSYPAVELRMEEDESASRLLFSSSAEKRSRRACIRLPHSDWSRPFSVDAVGTHGAIELEEELPPSHPERPCRLYELGVSVSLHPDPRFHRSRLLIIHPRVLLLNLTGHALQYRQVGTTECCTVQVQEQVAVHRFSSALKGRLSLRFASYGWHWSARRYGLAVDEVGSRFMRMRNHHTHEMAVLRVDAQLVQATFEVTVAVAWEQDDTAHAAPLQQPQHQLPATPSAHLSSSQLHRNASAPYVEHQRHRQRQLPAAASSSSTPSPLSPVLASGLTASHLSASDHLHRSSTLQSPLGHWQRHAPSSPSPSLPASAEDDAAIARSRQQSASARVDAVPYRIENFSLHTLVFYQSEEEQLSARILPYRSVLYAWDEPDGVRELTVAVLDPMAVMEEARSGLGYERGGRSRPRVLGRYSLDRIVRYPPVSLDSDPATVKNQLSVNVFADGRVRVLRVANADSHTASAAVQRPTSSSEDGGDAAAAAGSRLTLSVELRLAGLAVSVITHAMPSAMGSNLLLTRDPVTHALYHVLDVSAARPGRLEPPITRQELLHLRLSDLQVSLSQTRDRLSVDAAVGGLQIDNQLHSAVFPVVFCPVLMKREAAASAGSSPSSFLVVSVVSSLDKSRGDLLFFPHLSVRMQKMQLNVEEQLVAHLLQFVSLVSPAFAAPAAAASRLHSAHSSVVAASQPFASSSSSSSAASGGANNFHVSSELVVSSSQMLTAQKRRAKRAAKAASAAAVHSSASSASPHAEHSGGLQRKLSSDPALSLQYTGSVKRRTTVMPAPHGLSAEQSAAAAARAVQRLHPSHTGSASASSLVVGPAMSRAPPADPLLLYVQELIIYPVQVNVSYSASASLPTASSLSPHSHPLRFLLRALNVTLLNVDGAPLRLSSLALQDVFSSPSQLADRIRWHFLLQLSTGFYSLLGSSDLLGNPVGLFTSISSGLQSFFTEPAMGLVHSPQAFTSGVLRGTLSLLQHSAFGITNTTRGVMSSIAKGLTSLTMTDDRLSSAAAMRRRRERASSSHSSSSLMSSSSRLLSHFHSSSLSVAGRGLRTALSFASSAVELVSSAADRLSHAVNPQAKATRIRPAPLFELGLLASSADSGHSEAFLLLVRQYLREHPSQTFYCSVHQQQQQQGVSVALVLLTSRLLVLYSRLPAAAAAPLLMHDLPLSELISIRQSAGEAAGASGGSAGGCSLWFEQALQTGGGSAADRHVVQQLRLPLLLPPHLLALLNSVISACQLQRWQD